MSGDHEIAELDAAELDTWASLATLLEWLPQSLDAQLVRDAGLTHFEYGVLYALHRAPDRTLPMSIVASYSNSSLSRLSRAATRLESKGWMLRSPDPADGRVTLATLTDGGAAVVRRASHGHVELVRRTVFGALTTAQARQLGLISTRILSAMRTEPGWRPPR